MRHSVEFCSVPEYGFFNSRLFTVFDAIMLEVFCEVWHGPLVFDVCVNAAVCMKLCSVCG